VTDAGVIRRPPVTRKSTNTTPALIAVVVLSAAAAFLASSSPTASRWVDFLLLAVAGAIVALAASRAGDASLIWIGAVATLAAAPSWWTILAGAGFAIALLSSAFRAPVWVRALAGALAFQALLRLPPVGPFGTCSAIAVVACLPVLISGYRHCTSINKRRWSLSIAASLVALVILCSAAGLATFRAAPQLTQGADLARNAVQEAPKDEAAVTVKKLRNAEKLFSQAQNSLQPWWVKPSLGVPILGQHVRAATVAATAGESLSSTAAATAEKVDGSQSLVSNGQIDISLLSSYRPIAEQAAQELQTAKTEVANLTSGWLLPPVRRQVANLTDELSSAAPAAATTAKVLGSTDGILGVNEPRSYLVLATNPSETRELGGFVGGYVLIKVSNGRVEILQSGKASELNEALAAAAPKIGDAQFSNIYGRYQMDRYFNNVTAPADFSLAAAAARDAFAAATSTQVDGVILADPTGVAALLELTGAVDVPAAERTLDAKTVEQYLQADQYVQFEQDSSGRTDVLVDVARAVTEALFGRPLPGPAKIVSTLAPAVRGGHLMLISFDPQERQTLAATGVSGAFGTTPGHDFISVRGFNANANKIDSFLHRSINYKAEFDPRTGAVQATAEVVIRNDAPSSGLPPIVIGNDSVPAGNNKMVLAVHSALVLKGLVVDGVATPVETHEEFGGYSYRFILEVPAGATKNLSYELAGQINPGPEYRLDISAQPMVNPDRYTLTVSDGEQFQASTSNQLNILKGQATGSVPSQWRTPVEVTFRPS